MKKGERNLKKFVPAMLIALAIGITAAGAASATKDRPLDCDPACRINVLSGQPTTYPAGQPFLIRHGTNVGCKFPPEAAGKNGFVLEVDGVVRAEDVVVRQAFPPPETGCTNAVVVTGFDSTFRMA